MSKKRETLNNKKNEIVGIEKKNTNFSFYGSYSSMNQDKEKMICV